MTNSSHHPHAVEFLPPSTGSLARPVPATTPKNVLYVLGDHGGVRVDPSAEEFDAAKHSVVFGRDETEALVHVGGGDAEISRSQGWIYFDGRNWYLRNLGQIDIRLPASRSLARDNEVKLPNSYYPLFLDTPRAGRTYVVEVRVTKKNELPPVAPPADPAQDRAMKTLEQPEGFRDPSLLKPEDRLVVVALARGYLLHLEDPRPLSRDQVARILQKVAPETAWTKRVVDGRIARIRERLARQGIPGLRAGEFSQSDSLGNTLNHNLVSTLLSRGAITPKDLRMLGNGDADGDTHTDAETSTSATATTQLLERANTPNGGAGPAGSSENPSAAE